MSVVQAITLAGGFTPLAKETRVSVTRKVDEKEIVFVVDVKKMLNKKAVNVLLQAGDIVYVPERIF
jgi:polysaccharide export outer membrane protein